ncbi:MAG: hypothetical protein AABY34_03975 [Pseudomonadota bacterium]
MAKHLKEIHRTGGEFPVLGSNGHVGFHNSYLVKGPCLVIGRKGSAGALVWEENNCYPIDTAFYVKIQNPCPAPRHSTRDRENSGYFY